MPEDEKMDPVIAELRTRFRARLKPDAEAMRDTLRRLDDKSTPEARRDALTLLRADAHRLAGSAASFGFTAIGNAASRIESTARAVIEGGGEHALPAALGVLVNDLVALCEQEAGREASSKGS